MKKNQKGDIIYTMMRNQGIVYLIVVILIAFGVYSLIKMNKNEFPDFTIRQGVVAAVYPGASSEEIEEQLTKPLENFLFTFRDVDKQKTYSYTQNNIVYVFVELDKNVHNKNEVWSKIRHGLKDFKSTLPPGVLAIVVNDDFGDTSSLLISMDSDDKSIVELENYMNLLADKLRMIPSMGNVKIYGAQDEEINIYIDPDKLDLYGINSQTLMINLFSQGFLTTSGSIDNGEIISPVQVVGSMSSEYEIGEQIVFSDMSDNVIRLKDIATIKRQFAEPSSYITQNAKDALILSMEMRPGNNIVKFGKEVDVVIDEMQKILPDSVNITKVSDLPKVVDKSIYSFLRDLVLSILIVIAVMLILFPLRSALVAAIGIPVTVAITLAFMYIVGLELNTVTLAALIVVLGMIVDNSIVVIDGYIANLNQGHSRWYSALDSAKRFSGSLFMATFTISIMFYPFLFTLSGIFADFVRLFPYTITIALFVSLAIAIFMVPYLEFRFIKAYSDTDKPSLLTRVQNKFFKFLQGNYEKLVEQCFNHPKITMTFGALTIVAAVILFMFSPIQLMPLAERDCFAVEINLPIGSSLDRTAQVSDSMEKILLADERVLSVTKFVGTSSPRFMTAYAPNMPGSNYAQFIVNTKSMRDCESIIADYYDKYMDYFPEAFVRFKQLDYQSVKNPIEISLYGDDTKVLNEEAEKIYDYLHSRNGDLAWIHSDNDGYVVYTDVVMDKEQAARFGVTKTMLSANLATNLSGMPLTTIWENGQAIPVKLRINRETDNFNAEDLNNELVSTAVPGVSVPLSQISKVVADWKPAQIAHKNGVKCVTVSADVAQGFNQAKVLSDVIKNVDEKFKPNLPEGVTLDYGGSKAVNKWLLPEIAIGLIFSIFIMFFFLVFRFKKISISILSLASTILCLFGALVGLKIFGLNFSFTAILGIVSLVGIIARNAIIMYEYAEYLKNDKHLSSHDAALEAAKRRMRPIFLTSTTTAVGVVPMIISQSTLWMPLAVVICFGTVFSLLLIVTVLPVAYWKFTKN